MIVEAVSKTRGRHKIYTLAMESAILTRDAALQNRSKIGTLDLKGEFGGT